MIGMAALILFIVAGVMQALSKSYANSMVSFGLALLTYALIM